jgi:phenylalanyl-tRNA synthetase alpha chain
MKPEIVIDSKEEKTLRTGLEGRIDPDSLRLKRFLNLADLSRKEGSPIFELAKRITELPDFKDFDVIKVPEIVPVHESFDLFNFPANHPARSRSDTYYIDDQNILRTHTTIMWYYYLGLDEIKTKLKERGSLGVLSYGKVYRKDEIDRAHLNVFHQMDGLYTTKREEKEIGLPELENVLAKIAQAIYGPDIVYRFNKDTFPYTDPSLEMEIQIDGRWVEVLGAGVAHNQVLETLGVDPKIYNAWAFGFGLERLAILSMNLPDIRLLWSEDDRVVRQLKLGNHYKEVSKYPPITRDISFVVGTDFMPNNYFDLIRDIGGDLVEEVSLMDKYEDAKKFGEGRVSYTYHIVYRSNERTLTIEEINPLQDKLVEETKKQFEAEVR